MRRQKMLYTQQRHGSLPVEVLDRGFRVIHGHGVHREYPNARQLLMALHGGRDPGLSFDRYFQRGAYGKRRRRSRPVLEMWRRKATTKSLGIDLAHKWGDIPKLLQTVCGAAIRGNRYDFDDVLQEVYKGILSRNQGLSAYNPERASFARYVTLVCRSVFLNYHKKEQRRRRREWIGVTQDQGRLGSGRNRAVSAPLDTEEACLSQVGECVRDLADFIAEREDAWRQDATLYQDARLAREVLPLVYQGMRRSEIARVTGISTPAIGRALAYLRRAAQAWKGERVLH
jgi:RNA polymerase sigma factor (sigma-70 family)